MGSEARTGAVATPVAQVEFNDLGEGTVVAAGSDSLDREQHHRQDNKWCFLVRLYAHNGKSCTSSSTL